LSNSKTSGLESCPVRLDRNDSGQRLFGIHATLDGDAQGGGALGHVDRLTSDSDMRRRWIGQTGRLKKDQIVIIDFTVYFKECDP